MDMRYEVQLAKAENGFVCRVGCKVFVFEKWEELNKELSAYMTNQETELIRKYKPSFDQVVAPQTTAVPC